MWFEELAAGRVRSFADVARREHMAKRYVERLSSWRLWRPPSSKRFPRDVSRTNIEMLLNRIDLPLGWPAQLVAIRSE
jgi:hypothetical protein